MPSRSASRACVVDPVFDRDHRESRRRRACRSPGSSVDGPVEPWQPPRLFTPMTKKRSVSIGLPGPIMLSHQPTLSGSSGVVAGDVMEAFERMADQDRVGFVGVERAVGFVDQLVGGQQGAAGELQRVGEARELRLDHADGAAAGLAGAGIGAAGGGGEGGHGGVAAIRRGRRAAVTVPRTAGPERIFITGPPFRLCPDRCSSVFRTGGRRTTGTFFSLVAASPTRPGDQRAFPGAGAIARRRRGEPQKQREIPENRENCRTSVRFGSMRTLACPASRRLPPLPVPPRAAPPQPPPVRKT